MKKILLSVVATLVCITSIEAHNNILGLFNVGARIGIISSSEQLPTTSDQISQAIKADGTGWTGTVFARVNMFKVLYIQPELQYTNTTIKLPLEDLFGEENTVESHKYIDLPILVGAEIGLGDLASVRVNAGPVFAVASEKGFGDLTEEDFVGAYNDPKVSWTAGLGVKVFGFIAEVRYNGNFKDNQINTENLAESIDTNRTSWNLSLGIMF